MIHVDQDTFYSIAPVDTWAIFVQSDQIPLGQRMLQIFGTYMKQIDTEQVTKAPKIFHISPQSWTDQIKEKCLSKAQVVILILPDSIKLSIEKLMCQIEVPHILVSQDELSKQFLREKELMELKCKHTLRRALIRSGSVAFIHSQIPLFESPAMVIGMHTYGGNLFVVSSLDKSLSRLHSIVTKSD